MLTPDQLSGIEARLHDRMLSRLRLRWEKSGAYIPPGGSRVHVVAPLSEEDDRDFNLYLTAYRDAIEDFMAMINPEQAQLERLAATMPPHLIRMADWQPDILREHEKRRGRHRPVKGRAGRSKSDARRRAEELFEGGGGDG